MSLALAPRLVWAVQQLWRSGPITTNNLFAEPAFCQLREVCQSLYPEAGSEQAMTFALSQAIGNLGFGWRDQEPALHAIPAETAATRLDAAFRQTNAKRIHLCPLDLGDEVPERQFGPNQIRTFTAKEFDDLVDPDRVHRRAPGCHFESNRFSQFSWLVVEEDAPLPSTVGARAIPLLFGIHNRDFGRIEPHKPMFPTPVEEALFAVLTAPWEDVVQYKDFDWRPFRVPWIFTLVDDLFARRAPIPDADTLTWEPDIFEDQDGEVIEQERPSRLQLKEGADAATAYLDDKAWSELVKARRSTLITDPMRHFFVRAFASDGIDEFLAHITTIEAALGLSIDHDGRRRRKLNGITRSGATARVAWRVAGLLDDATAAASYCSLFKVRSDFVHGREMQDIPSKSRVEARRLARRCVCGLIREALDTSRSSARENLLEDLLDKGLVLKKAVAKR